MEIIVTPPISPHFDNWKRADVYSLGLMLWEITRRCNYDGMFEEYQVMIIWLLFQAGKPAVKSLHPATGQGDDGVGEKMSESQTKAGNQKKFENLKI